MGRRSRSLRHRAVALIVGAAVALAGAVTAAAVVATSSPVDYRTGHASESTVSQTMDVSGQATPVDDVTADFQVAGTVAAVDVTTGQSVSAGQTLATLDITPLEQAVSAAQATLTGDREQLAEDEAAEVAGSNGPGETTTAGSTSGSTSKAPQSTAPATSHSGAATLAKAQQAVVDAQKSVDAELEQEAAAVAQSTAVCGGSSSSDSDGGSTKAASKGDGPETGGGTGSAISGTSTPGTSTPGTSTPGTSTPGTPGAGSGPTAPACAAALEAALPMQERVASDEATLASAEATLASLLGATGTGTTDPTAEPTSAGDSSGTSVQGSGDRGTAAANDGPVDLADDQSAIDSATASLIEAEQNLAAATLVSPIAGTVAAVGLHAGLTVGAASATDSVTVISDGSFELTASLTGSQAERVKVGDTAHVVVDGSNADMSGTVSRVGPAQTGSSGTSYPMIISLSGAGTSIRAGAAGEATVVLSVARHVLTVPTSAVHTTSPGHSYVDELRGGRERRQPVATGVVGALRTEVLSGLRSGDVVVLADPTLPVPSSTAGTTTSGLGPTGGGPVSVHAKFIGRPPGA